VQPHQPHRNMQKYCGNRECHLAGALLGPLGAKIQSLPAERGSLSDRWVEATRDYDFVVLAGEGHADCAMGWLYGMALVPVVAAAVWVIGLIVAIPVHVSAFAISLPGMISLAGFAWSAMRHLTRGLFARWKGASRPSLIDDVVAVATGSLVAYYLQTV
jgi:hypothetical protein